MRMSMDDSGAPCGEGATHEEISTGEAHGLVVPADDSAVDAVGELVDVLCEHTCLQ